MPPNRKKNEKKSSGQATAQPVDELAEYVDSAIHPELLMHLHQFHIVSLVSMQAFYTT
jgi:hypothetical protein